MTDEQRSSRVPRSMALYEQAVQRIPGGTQLISRRPNRTAYGVSPVYVSHARGSRFWDVDGHEYIDWISGIGAILLGYCDPVVDAAVQRQVTEGSTFAINHPLEVELAEALCDTIPCAEMVRYAKCGGEACAIAVRIARGATGRDKVLFCGYHGWHDWYLAANLGDEASLNQHLFPGIEPIGVPQALAGTAFPFPYGDYEALQSLLDRHAGEVAAVIMEPMRSAIPPAGYLEQVARATRAAGAVLVFDEVSAGYRYAFGGAQQYLGVTPDMAVFAKSMSNGYPMAAVVGRRDVMEAAGRMFISSTYWSDAIGLRAALTTLQEVRRRDLPAQLRRFGHDLKSCIQAAADATGAPIACTGHEVHPQLEFKIDDPLRRAQASTLYIQEMARRGCHGYASFYLNAAQDDADLRQTETAAREAFALIRTALDADALEHYLECELRQDAFRRLVR